MTIATQCWCCAGSGQHHGIECDRCEGSGVVQAPTPSADEMPDPAFTPEGAAE